MTKAYLALDSNRARAKFVEDYGYRTADAAIAAIKAETGYPVVVPANEAVLAHEMARALEFMGFKLSELGNVRNMIDRSAVLAGLSDP